MGHCGAAVGTQRTLALLGTSYVCGAWPRWVAWLLAIANPKIYEEKARLPSLLLPPLFSSFFLQKVKRNYKSIIVLGEVGGLAPHRLPPLLKIRPWLQGAKLRDVHTKRNQSDFRACVLKSNGNPKCNVEGHIEALGQEVTGQDDGPSRLGPTRT